MEVQPGAAALVRGRGSGSQPRLYVRIIWEALMSTDAWAPLPEILIQPVWGAARAVGSKTPQEISIIPQDSESWKEGLCMTGGWAASGEDRGEGWRPGPDTPTALPPHLEADPVGFWP